MHEALPGAEPRPRLARPCVDVLAVEEAPSVLQCTPVDGEMQQKTERERERKGKRVC